MGTYCKDTLVTPTGALRRSTVPIPDGDAPRRQSGSTGAERPGTPYRSEWWARTNRTLNRRTKDRTNR